MRIWLTQLLWRLTMEERMMVVRRRVRLRSQRLMNENDRNGGVAKLETVKSLDWRRVMAEDPNCE
ncbi:uncharacterized protein DS421_5g148110 [Arachis hypogaea]|nr:uncharacterized protein DS421_5g148110 [Arachis hypogaea]